MALTLDVENLPLQALRDKFDPVTLDVASPPLGTPSFGFWGARIVTFWSSRPKGDNSCFSWNDLAFRLIQESNKDDNYNVVKKRTLDLHEEFEERKANLDYFTRLTLFFREQILSYLVPSWDTYGLLQALSES